MEDGGRHCGFDEDTNRNPKSQRIESVSSSDEQGCRQRRGKAASRGPSRSSGTLKAESRDRTLKAERNKDARKKEKRKKNKEKKDKKKERKRTKKKRQKRQKQGKVRVTKKRKGQATSSSSYSSSTSTPSSVYLATLNGRMLQAALEHGNVLLVQRAVEKHGVTWKSENGDGFLHLAARANNVDLITWILAHERPGLELDMRNSRGETPLLVAARLFRGAIALRLVEATADPGASDLNGETPEAFDIDGLLEEAERHEQMKQRTEQDRLLQAVAAARKAREDVEWRERLFYEAGLEEVDQHTGYEDLEQQDARSSGRHWADDIAAEAQQRARAEQRARVRECLRAALEAKTQARKEAEAAARKAAEFQKEQEQQSSQRRQEHVAAEGDAEEARITARSKDDERWQQFEANLKEAAKMGQPLLAADIPWPSGPSENPLNINPGGHPSVIRSQIRAGLLRWHPDKFVQRMGKLAKAGGEEETILSKVKDISQQLNQLMAGLLKGTAATSTPG